MWDFLASTFKVVYIIDICFSSLNIFSDSSNFFETSVSSSLSTNFLK